MWIREPLAIQARLRNDDRRVNGTTTSKNDINDLFIQSVKGVSATNLDVSLLCSLNGPQPCMSINYADDDSQSHIGHEWTKTSVESIRLLKKLVPNIAG